MAEELFFRGALWSLVAESHPVVKTTLAYTATTATTRNPALVLAGTATSVLFGLRRRTSGAILAPALSGASAFDIFDQGTHNQHAIRFYNADRNLTRRVIYDQYFSQVSNPLTGAAVPYTQHTTTTDVLAVPGDPASATKTITGQNNFTVPHMGAVSLNAGKIVFGADGTLEFSAGPQGFLDYFTGYAAALDELCSALGAS